MKITFVEIAGFRGVRTPLRISIPQGFLVLTGRNGSGKSTVCDAIEFALTGAISKYGVEKERGESIEDYVWWRGRETATNAHVLLEIQSRGERVTIYRDPQGLRVDPDVALSNVLCDATGAPSDALAQLCRTTIIRDETLAALSVDQSEAERFDFVRTGLGTHALDNVNVRGKAVLTAIRVLLSQAEQDYANARNEVTSGVRQLTETQVAVRGSESLEPAIAHARALLRKPEGDATLLLQLGLSRVSELKQKAQTLESLRRRLTELKDRIETLNSRDRRVHIETLQSEIEGLRTRLRDLEPLRDELSTRAKSDETNAAAADRAALHTHGQALGLINGKCPLCASPLSEPEFRKALEQLRDSVRQEESDIAEHSRTLARTTAEMTALREKLTDAELTISKEKSEQTEVARELQEVQATALALGVTLSEERAGELVDGALKTTRVELEQLQRTVGILEASTYVDRVSELSDRVAHARVKSEEAEQRMREALLAESNTKTAMAGIRRSVGELVEERLASLAPLLSDLYSRLRPHSDWEQIHYHLRGDVRRLLSLRVGDDLNPRFTFSSGQRRAIGLAFLLAVHLSRSWCKLNTIILDDPIQHIDDYRSLHLVEVLGAMRRAGEQVICAVEDPALADVLCRRLRVSDSDEGALVELRYQRGSGVEISRTEQAPTSVRQLVLTA